MPRSKLIGLVATFFAPLLHAAAPDSFTLAQWIKPVPCHSVLAEPGYYDLGGSAIPALLQLKTVTVLVWTDLHFSMDGGI